MLEYLQYIGYLGTLINALCFYYFVVWVVRLFQQNESLESPLSQELQNYLRLMILINKKGTEAMRECVTYFACKTNGKATLVDVLSEPYVKNAINSIKNLTKIQRKSFYPDGNPIADASCLDITMCYVLLRNLCSLTEPSTGWNDPPQDGDTSLEGALALLKTMRNTLSHSTNACLSNADFNLHFKKCEEALLVIERHLPEWKITKHEILQFRTVKVTSEMYQDMALIIQGWLQEETGGITKEITKGATENVKNFDDVRGKISDGAKSNEKNFTKVQDMVNVGKLENVKHFEEVKTKIDEGASENKENFIDVKDITTKIDERLTKMDEEDESQEQIQEILELNQDFKSKIKDADVLGLDEDTAVDLKYLVMQNKVKEPMIQTVENSVDGTPDTYIPDEEEDILETSDKESRTHEMLNKIMTLCVNNERKIEEIAMDQRKIEDIVHKMNARLTDMDAEQEVSYDHPSAQILFKQCTEFTMEHNIQYAKSRLVEVAKLQQEGIFKYEIGSEYASQERTLEKTILILGESGIGKSALVNAIANYVVGVRPSDNFRFRLVEEEANQTECVRAYKLHHMKGFRVDYTLTIIDCAGFGGSRALEKNSQIVNQIASFLRDEEGKFGCQKVSAVCVFTRSNLKSAVTFKQTQYIVDTILGLVGKDISKNLIHVCPSYNEDSFNKLFTHFWNQEMGHSAQCCVGINSDNLHPKNEPEDHDRTREMFALCCGSVLELLIHLRDIKEVDLKLTKEVISIRVEVKEKIEALYRLLLLRQKLIPHLRGTWIQNNEELKKLEAWVREVTNEPFNFTDWIGKTLGTGHQGDKKLQALKQWRRDERVERFKDSLNWIKNPLRWICCSCHSQYCMQADSTGGHCSSCRCKNEDHVSTNMPRLHSKYDIKRAQEYIMKLVCYISVLNLDLQKIALKPESYISMAYVAPMEVSRWNPHVQRGGFYKVSDDQNDEMEYLEYALNMKNFDLFKLKSYR